VRGWGGGGGGAACATPSGGGGRMCWLIDKINNEIPSVPGASATLALAIRTDWGHTAQRPDIKDLRVAVPNRSPLSSKTAQRPRAERIGPHAAAPNPPPRCARPVDAAAVPVDATVVAPTTMAPLSPGVRLLRAERHCAPLRAVPSHPALLSGRCRCLSCCRYVHCRPSLVYFPIPASRDSLLFPLSVERSPRCGHELPAFCRCRVVIVCCDWGRTAVRLVTVPIGPRGTRWCAFSARSLQLADGSVILFACPFPGA